jgi:hypothetical protein
MPEPDDWAWYAGSDDPALEETQPLPAAETPAGDLVAADKPAEGADDGPDQLTGRVGCRTELRGWAGAHLHGAVRPRRRASRRGRPPGRWC